MAGTKDEKDLFAIVSIDTETVKVLIFKIQSLIHGTIEGTNE